MFKTETHLHVSEVSPCGHLGAEEMVRRYAEAGYHTVFISDHFTGKFFGNLKDMPNEEKIDAFLKGYELARRAGAKYGLRVLMSAELQLNESSHHYLLYNVDRDFLLSVIDCLNMPIAEFYAYAKAHGVTVIHAHPYRDGAYEPWDTVTVDAVEAHNSNPRHDNLDDTVRAYAQKHALPVTAGSDAHRPEDVAGTGVLTPFPIECAEDYVRAVIEGSAEIIYGGAR